METDVHAITFKEEGSKEVKPFRVVQLHHFTHAGSQAVGLSSLALLSPCRSSPCQCEGCQKSRTIFTFFTLSIEPVTSSRESTATSPATTTITITEKKSHPYTPYLLHHLYIITRPTEDPSLVIIANTITKVAPANCYYYSVITSHTASIPTLQSSQQPQRVVLSFIFKPSVNSVLAMDPGRLFQIITNSTLLGEC